MIFCFFFDKIVIEVINVQGGDDREAEGNALLMRRMATPYRGFESLSLRNKKRKIPFFFNKILLQKNQLKTKFFFTNGIH